MTEKQATTSQTRTRSQYGKIYVEEDILTLPASVLIMEKYPSAAIIPIKHYKDIFNRPRQDWRGQKRNPSLILAKRRSEFIYDASAYTPSFGHPRFYYNALALNCVFDCSYCYLQGMFPSAYTTLFLNNEDYFAATDQALQEGPLYLALSYDTDLMALEHLYPYCQQWVEYTRSRENLTVELRTKSIRYKLLRGTLPLDRFIIAWTLSPEAIIKKYEPGTPSLSARLKSLKEAVSDGWPVRVCIDPMLWSHDWKDIYGEFLDRLRDELRDCTLLDFSVGVFRINKDYLKNMQKRATVSDLLYYPYQTEGNLATYEPQKKEEMVRLVQDKLSGRNEPILVW